MALLRSITAADQSPTDNGVVGWKHPSRSKRTTGVDDDRLAVVFVITNLAFVLFATEVVPILMASRLLPEGGVVVADNLLRHGNVPADDAAVEERWAESAAALRAFNETFVDHEQLYAIITPQGDGTGIGMKTR